MVITTHTPLWRASAALLAAGCWLAAVGRAGAVSSDVQSDELLQPSLNVGLSRSQMRGSALSRKLFQRAATEAVTTRSGNASANSTGQNVGNSTGNSSQHRQSSGDLLVPQENDTISEEYWSEVDGAISQAKAHVKASVEEEKDKDIHATSPTTTTQYQNVDTPDKLPQEDQSWYNWDRAMPRLRSSLRSMHNDTGALNDLAMQPFDMQLGAKVMFELSKKNPTTPPPSQMLVNEEYSARCPMVMFGTGLYVGAPLCNSDLSSTMGTWQDNQQTRTVLHWKGNGGGGVRFDVDSAVSGPGSVSFANIREVMTVDSYVYSLTNCLNTETSVVEESIIKIDRFGRGATTATDHDLSSEAEAFFYKYSIKNPSSGELMAETTLYRADTATVNITVVQEGSLEGAVVASATRVGAWRDSAHFGCTSEPRGWNISFPTAPSAFATVATVQDLRVAAAVVVTLMSFRDQDVASDGLQHLGQANMFWSLFKSLVGMVFASTFLCVAWEVFHARGFDKKLRRIFFRLEVALLPQRPATKEWNLPLRPTW